MSIKEFANGVDNMEDRYLFKAKHFNEWHIGNIVKEPDGLYIRRIKKNVMAYIDDESTICQCTGLKDKNGKLIWEKDIIRCKLGKVIVLWDEAQWKVKKCDEVFIWYKDLYFWVSDRSTEVIGNIFDNPELLESEE